MHALSKPFTCVLFICAFAGTQAQTFEQLTHEGDSLLAASNYPAAIRAYSEAIRLAPLNSAGYAFRGQAYFVSEKDSAALRDFARAIELDPRSVKAYYLRGRTERIIGQVDAALSDLNKAIELDSSFIPAYVERGYSWAAKDMWQMAWVYFNLAITKDPNQPADIYYRRGYGYQIDGAYEQAVADYDHALMLEPGSLDPLLNSANCLVNLRKLDDAIKRYDKLIVAAPNDGRPYYGRGSAKILKGDVDAGCVDLNFALSRGVSVAQDLISKSCK
jgi:tetratricopeptide (TPR) repeat protein